jgi:hypothetical protein
MIRAKVSSKFNEENKDVFFILEQENNSEVLLKLADAAGNPIYDSEILRITQANDFNSGNGPIKLRLCRIIGRDRKKLITDLFHMDGSTVEVR